MAPLSESIDDTDKDFDALRARLIKSVFPNWTDFDVASSGNLPASPRTPSAMDRNLLAAALAGLPRGADAGPRAPTQRQEGGDRLACAAE